MMESPEELRIKLMAFVLRGHAMSGLMPSSHGPQGPFESIAEVDRQRWLAFAAIVVAISDRLRLMQRASEGRNTSEFDVTPRVPWRGSVSDFVTDLFGVVPKDQHVEVLGELTKRLL